MQDSPTDGADRRHPDNRIFDWIAPIWDALAGALLLGEVTRRVVADQPNAPIVDLGGGTGRLAARLADAGLAAMVIDPSLPMTRRARGKGLPALAASGHTLPLDDETLGALVVVDALHHMPDQRSVVGEIARVLRPGGAAILLEPDLDTLFGRVVAAAEWVARMGSRLSTAAELRDLLAGAGLEVSALETRRGHVLATARRPEHGGAAHSSGKTSRA